MLMREVEEQISDWDGAPTSSDHKLHIFGRAFSQDWRGLRPISNFVFTRAINVDLYETRFLIICRQSAIAWTWRQGVGWCPMIPLPSSRQYWIPWGQPRGIQGDQVPRLSTVIYHIITPSIDESRNQYLPNYRPWILVSISLRYWNIHNNGNR